MANGKLTKDRQYHGQKKDDKRQTIPSPKGNYTILISDDVPLLLQENEECH
jgi:hypothetical protein